LEGQAVFKALHLPTGQYVVSVDAGWTPEQLQEWCRRDEIVCPGYGGPVNYRPRVTVRSHFAHRSLTDCRYADAEAFVLEGRLLLYSFFRRKTEGKSGWNVDLERQLPGGELADVWVKPPQGPPVAYKLFPRGRRSGIEELTRQAERAGARLFPILSMERRTWACDKLPGGRPDLLVIPPVDRRLTVWRQWDQYHVYSLREPSRYESVCYLDVQQSRLVLYRKLCPGGCHPNTYAFAEVLDASLEELLVWHGELVFPAEFRAKEKWTRWERKARALQELEVRRQAETRATMRIQTSPHPQPVSGVAAGVARSVGRKSRTARIPPIRADLADPPATCEVCGRVTTDYWDRTGDRCKCRACLIRSRGVEPVICRRCERAQEPDRIRDGLCISCLQDMRER